MDPILENEATTADALTKNKTKHKHKKKKNIQDSENQTVIGEKKRFVVTTLSTTKEDEVFSEANIQGNLQTVHFGTHGVESQRPHVETIFKEQSSEQSQSNNVEKIKEYETFHGTSTSPKTSIFDIFKLRRKSDSKKHQSIIQNVKAALVGSPKLAKTPETSKNDISTEHKSPKNSHKKYYHTVTGASSRKYSPITRMMDIFRSKPITEPHPNTTELTKKKSSKQIRRSSIGTTSPTYHKNSYASLDPMLAKQLFREIRGLPKYDPYLSIVQISLGGRDKTRLLLNFFKYHKCYEILPKSAKVIIFDTQFSVRKTFPTLISHGIRSAPLWDAKKKQLAGMITATDFIRILLHYDSNNLPMDDIEKHTLYDWRKILRPTRKPLHSVNPDQSLHEAINLLNKNRVHRLLMIDTVSGDVLYVLSHKRILRFLFVYLNEFPELTFFHKNLIDLKIGTYEGIISTKETTTIKEAFQLMLNENVSALPVLDENGKLLDVYAKYDVLNLVSEKLYLNLGLTVKEVRNRKKDWEEKLQKCRSTITLYEALEIIVRTESHRLLLVNKDDILVGLVSLSDILTYLNRIIPVEKKPQSSLQEIFKPLKDNKVTESPKETENEVISIEVPKLVMKTYETEPALNTQVETKETIETENVEIDATLCEKNTDKISNEVNEIEKPTE